MSCDIRSVQKVAREAALEAGAFLRAQLHGDKAIQFKGAVDMVTQVDTEAQRLVTDRIRRAFPGHAFLAEEEGLEGVGNLEEGRWIVDPLDGTTNFVHEVPHFCVSIAFEQAGALQVGVIYDPCRDELFEAVRGEGAWLNGRPIRVSPEQELLRALLGTGFPYDRIALSAEYLVYYDAFMRRTQGLRRFGSAALDLAYVACGRLDGFWEFKLKPWDVAAGMILVEEAGGRVVGRDGRTASITDGLFVAAGPGLLPLMLEVMAPLADPLLKTP